MQFNAKLHEYCSSKEIAAADPSQLLTLCTNSGDQLHRMGAHIDAFPCAPCSWNVNYLMRQLPNLMLEASGNKK